MALNFAFEEEAETFLHFAKTTVASRNRRREGKAKNKKFYRRLKIILALVSSAADLEVLKIPQNVFGLRLVRSLRVSRR